MGRPAKLGMAVVALLLASGLGFWAGRVTMVPGAGEQELPASEVVAEVRQQTVGKVLNLNVTVTQTKRPIASNTLRGVVTMVAASGEKNTGDVVYSVGARPVRVVAGQIPFHRDLGPGLAGPDVRQLREALVSMKLADTAGDAWDPSTTEAVRAWQEKLGVEQTGTVPLGEVVAIPHLPGLVVIDDQVVSVGLTLAGNEKILYAAAGEPSFLLTLSPEQVKLVPQTATVSVKYKDHRWPAVVTGTQENERNQISYVLSAPGGGPVCGTECRLDNGGKDMYLLSEVAVVPAVTGPGIPVGAITTNPDRSTTVTVVTDMGDQSRPVVVKGSQDGIAVVEGLQVGERVRVLAGKGSGPAASGKTAGTGSAWSSPSPSIPSASR